VPLSLAVAVVEVSDLIAHQPTSDTGCGLLTSAFSIHSNG
jgi:hypothetical protein